MSGIGYTVNTFQASVTYSVGHTSKCIFYTLKLPSRHTLVLVDFVTATLEQPRDIAGNYNIIQLISVGSPCNKYTKKLGIFN